MKKYQRKMIEKTTAVLAYARETDSWIKKLDSINELHGNSIGTLATQTDNIWKRLDELSQQAADLELMRKRLDKIEQKIELVRKTDEFELEDGRRFSAAEFGGMLADAHKRLAALEGWVQAAQGGCTSLKRIPLRNAGAKPAEADK